MQQEIRNDVQIINQVRFFIEQLRAPFGFLGRDIEGLSAANGAAGDETKPDHRFHAKEEQLAQQFDVALGQMQAKYKIQTIPWLVVTKVVVWILLVLTLVQMLKRPAVLTLTVAGVALYVLEYPQTITRNTFRQLVLLIICSWIYDFF